jgi:ATP-binding cassette subfamily F protein uup
MQAPLTAQKEKKTSNAAEERQLKKDKVRLERQIEKANTRILELEAEQEIASFDPERLTSITHELEAQRSDKHKLEDEWLQVTLNLEA